MPAIAPLVVSKFDAACALAVCTKTIDALIASGDLRSIKLGRRRLIPVSALAELVEARQRPTGEGVQT